MKSKSLEDMKKSFNLDNLLNQIENNEDFKFALLMSNNNLFPKSILSCCYLPTNGEINDNRVR